MLFLSCRPFVANTTFSTPTRPIESVVLTTKAPTGHKQQMLDGRTVENKGKLILTEILPSVQKHDIQKYWLLEFKQTKFWKPTITIISDLNSVKCPIQETKVTSTPTRPVENVVLTTKGLQDRNIQILHGTTVENKGKTIH